MKMISKDELARIIVDIALRHGLYQPYRYYLSVERYCPDRKLCYAIRDKGIETGALRPGCHYDVRVVFGQDFRDWSDMEFHKHLNFDLDGTIHGYGPYDQEIVDWHRRPLWCLGWQTQYPRTGEGLLTLEQLGEHPFELGPR